MTRLSKFGEIIDDGNCPGCHKPLKAEWVACPHCGAPLDVAATRIPTGHESLGRISQRDISSRRTIAPATLPELEAWARSTDGLDYYSDDATKWARDRLPFFEEHDFTLFKELQSWARSTDGLDYYSDDATKWARDRLPFFEEHDFTLFKELQSWACSTDGLDYYSDDAAKWAFHALPQAEAGADIEEIKR